MAQSVAFSIPLKPGMYEQIHAHLDEMVDGMKGKDSEQHAKQNLGLETIKIFHQTNPVESLVFYFEAEDLEHALHSQKHQGHDVHDAWQSFFDQVTPHGGDLRERGGQPFAELLVDWHHQQGHRHNRKAAQAAKRK